MLRLILKENSFQFNGKHCLKTHGTVMGTKTAVSFANIFMAHIETTILSRTVFKPTVWGNATLTISFPYGTSVNETSKPSSTKRTYITQLSNSRPKYLTLRLSLDTVVYKGTRFKEKSILDVKTHFKKTETFQYIHFTSCHPPSLKKGFVKGEALRILRTNFSKTTFEENISNFKKRLIDRGYPETMIENPSIRYKVHREGLCSPETQQQRGKRNIAFRDTVPALSVYFKRSFNEKLDLIQNQPLLRQTFKETNYHFLQERKIPKGHAR